MQLNIDTHAFTKPILQMWLIQMNIQIDRYLPQPNHASLEVTSNYQEVIHAF